MEKKKIMFVDIDGVLNSIEVADQWDLLKGDGGFGGFFDEKDIITKDNVRWGEDLVRNLKYIVDQTGAEIVISSTWRKHFSVVKFKEMFHLYGWNAPVIDVTPSLRGSRGLEVNAWLDQHPEVNEYVIIDDNNWFLPDQQSNFIKTDIEVGLTMNDAKRAINILNGMK